MESQQVLRARSYLNRFNKILDEMCTKMLSAKPNNSITLYFIECMIPHHQAAIYMCNSLLEYTTYQPLQKIARDIIEMQTRGIEEMQEIAKTTMGYFNTKREMDCYVEKYLAITKNMICRMKNSPRCVNINLNFVGEMIPHHEGAIEMCNNLLQYCIDPRLKQVAETIIKEQSEGVKELISIRKMLCGR